MMEWWKSMTPLARGLTVMATACTATLAAVLAIGNAIHASEPYWLATRQHVRSEIGRATDPIKAVELRQIDTQIRQEKHEKNRVLDKIADRELLLRQNPDMPFAARVAIDEQIRNWRDDISELNYSIDQLQRSRSGRRP